MVTNSGLGPASRFSSASRMNGESWGSRHDHLADPGDLVVDRVDPACAEIAATANYWSVVPQPRGGARAGRGAGHRRRE